MTRKSNRPNRTDRRRSRPVWTRPAWQVKLERIASDDHSESLRLQAEHDEGIESPGAHFEPGPR